MPSYGCGSTKWKKGLLVTSDGKNPDDYTLALQLSGNDKPDWAKIYKVLAKASEAGDARAKYAIATWLLAGKDGVLSKDPEKAMVLLKEIENANIAEANFDLALAYDAGDFIRKNEKRAFRLYVRAALLGDPESCFQVSEFYREGKVVGVDLVVSRAWKERSKCSESDISPPYRVKLK